MQIRRLFVNFADMSKGRDSKLIEARNRRLFERYFYWTEERRLRFDDTIRILSNEEFYLSESRVLHIIRDMIKRGETVDGKQMKAPLFTGFRVTPSRPSSHAKKVSESSLFP